MAKDNIFSEDNEVKSSFISWGKTGDYFVGTFIGKRVVPNTLSEKNPTQTVYEFKMKEGTFHTLDDKKNPVEPAVVINKGDIYNVGGKAAIDAQMRNVKHATIVGMKFIEEKPPKTKGYNPTKVIKVYTAGEFDQEYIEEEEADPVAQAIKADKTFNEM
jgi:hypothetical protein